MKLFLQFSLMLVLVTGIQACGGNKKAENTTDNTQSTTDSTSNTSDSENKDNTSPTDSSQKSSTKGTDVGNPEKNSMVERSLAGVWEQKKAETKFTFGPEANQCAYINPVTSVKGTYRVENGNMLIVEGKNADAPDDKTPYKAVYKIIEISEKAPYKLIIEQDGVKMPFDLTKSFGD